MDSDDLNSLLHPMPMNQSPDMETEVVIIGAGITGVSLGWELAKRKKKVIVVDKRGIGDEGSGRNAGAVRAQNRDRKEFLLGMEGAKLWGTLNDQIRQELGIDIEYRQNGNLRLITEGDDVESFENAVKWQCEHGLEVKFLSPDDVFKMLPHLSPRLKLLGATYCPTDITLNPQLATYAIAIMGERLGVKFLLRRPVRSINIKGGLVEGVTTSEYKIRAQVVVIAAGPWSPALLKTLDINFPINVGFPTMFVTERVPPIIRGEMVNCGKYISMRQSIAGNVIFIIKSESGADLDNYSIPSSKFLLGAQKIVESFPVLENVRLLRSWLGFTDWTYDAIPVIDRIASLGQLYIAAGFSGHGFCPGPLVGRALAEWINGEARSTELANFNFNRLKNYPLLSQ